MVFNMSKNIDLDEEIDPEIGSVEKLRELSQDFTPSQELETLIQSIFDSCRDDEVASLNLVKDGIVIEILKLMNSPSRTVRKYSAAIMATVTRGIDIGITSFIDYDGVSLVMQTIRTEDDDVIRRLLVTSLSNSLSNQEASRMFYNEDGLVLYFDIMESDSDAVTRSKASLGLGNFINQSEEFALDAVKQDCVEILLDLLNHKHPKCKVAAARTLGLLIFKIPNQSVQSVLDSKGVETLIQVLENESTSADVKFPASWCLSQIVEKHEQSKSVCKEREQLLGVLEKLKENQDYSRDDKPLLMQSLNILIELIKWKLFTLPDALLTNLSIYIHNILLKKQINTLLC